MPYTVDTTDALIREYSIAFSFTHEFGAGEEYAMLGRYTFMNGGKGRSVEYIGAEKVAKNGGFIGGAWNKPFGYSNQVLSMALMYGQASDYKKDQGFNNLYGTEIFWKFKPLE